MKYLNYYALKSFNGKNYVILKKKNLKGFSVLNKTILLDVIINVQEGATFLVFHLIQADFQMNDKSYLISSENRGCAHEQTTADAHLETEKFTSQRQMNPTRLQKITTGKDNIT